MNETQKRFIKLRNEVIPGEFTVKNQFAKFDEELAEFQEDPCESECADLVGTLFGIATVMGWNIEKTLIDKMEQYRDSVWVLDERGVYQRVKDKRAAAAIPHDRNRDVPNEGDS
jgi:predicted house-cleaning noncanonical NTP pyrophosphatase (MazG superfamily)